MPQTETLEARLEALDRSLADLQQRLARVEERLGEGPSVGPSAAETASPEPEPPEPLGAPFEPARAEDRDPETRSLPEQLTYAGRTLLVLGGAYVLRALTESGALPPALGVVLGLLYGAGWIALAWRASGRGMRHSAVAHGVAGAAVGLPLVWETTVRFELLSPALGAALLFAFVAGLYGVAWRRDLLPLAWVAGIGGFATAVATMLGAANLPPFVGVLVLLGGLALASEASRGWEGLAWTTALAADFGVVLLTLGVGIERLGVDPALAIASQLLLPLVYVSLLGVLAIRDRRPIDGFAMVQSTVATLLGVGGAMVSLDLVPRLVLPLGGVILGFALVCYAVAFRVVDRARRKPFHYFGTLGTVLALFATELLLPRPELVWAALVPLAAVAGWRLGRLSLGTHAALFAVAAAWGSGLIAEGIRAFAASSGTPWDPPATAASLTLGAIVVALAFPSPVSPYQGRFRGASRLVLLTLAVWGLCAVLVRIGAWALGLEPGAGTDPGALAALRSAVLAATAVALAWSSRTEHLRSARWLVYPVLAAGILKLGLQDFVVGSPATLVLSFLAYGTALIVAPRLRRGDA